MTDHDRPVRNPHVLLREEFDDWAILFDPDTAEGFGLNPTGVYVWKLFDGEHSIDGIFKALRQNALEVPEEAGTHVVAFVEELTRRGLLGYNADAVHDDRGRSSLCSTGVSGNVPHERRKPSEGQDVVLRYERPLLGLFTMETRAQGYCSPGSGASGACDGAPSGECSGGNNAGTCGCNSGTKIDLRSGCNQCYACASGTIATGEFSCNTGAGASCVSGNSG